MGYELLLFTRDTDPEQEMIGGMSEELYRTVFENAVEGLYRTTPEGRFLSANQAMAGICGYDSPQALMTALSNLPEQLYIDPADSKDFLDRLRTSGRVSGFECRFRRKDGEVRWAAVHARAVADEAGTFVAVEGIFEDVTERKARESALQSELKRGREERVRAERLLAESHRLLQTVVDTMPDALFYKDDIGVYRLVNRAFAALFGREPEDILGLAEAEIWPPDAGRRRAEAALSGDTVPSGDATEGVRRSQSTLAGADGRPREVLVCQAAVRDADGRLAGIVGSVVDITERVAMEAALRQAEESYRALFNEALDGIFQSVPGGPFTRVNPALARMLGYDSPAQLGDHVVDMAADLFVDQTRRWEFLRELLDSGRVEAFEAPLRRRDGSVFWASISARTVRGREGTVELIEGLVRDVTEQHQEVAELSRRASHDELTGLPNRHYFQETFARMLDQARRSGMSLALLYIDLDGFKAVNDEFGHASGDALLRQVAGRIRSRLRATDLAARLGGDEFAVVLWDVSGAIDVEPVARSLIRGLSRPVDLGEGLTCRVGASVGASLFPEHGQDPAGLLDRADQAMYSVKQAGKNGFALAAEPGPIQAES